MFGWFRKYVRKIGLFGVEVEFHPPSEPIPISSGTELTAGRPSPPPPGDHGSDSGWYTKWKPTPQVIALRAEYKDRIWAAGNIDEIQSLLREFWLEEQAIWATLGEQGWSDEAKAAFFRATGRVNDRRMAINVMEGIQRNDY